MQRHSLEWPFVQTGFGEREQPILAVLEVSDERCFERFLYLSKFEILLNISLLVALVAEQNYSVIFKQIHN